MENMLRKIDAFIAAEEKNIIRDIARLVEIPSVEGEAEPGAPFGRGPKQVLEEALKIASGLGLETENLDNYVGWASVGGEGRPYFATVTHLDVVPAGSGWTGDPFRVREREGFLLGRGVMDDKGPSVLCLYALKFLKESGLPVRYPVRAILGTNEETGMEDMVYYEEHCEAPFFAFSPDANFPMIRGEKGIFFGTIRSRCEAKTIRKACGSEAANAIPTQAEAWLDCEKEPQPSDRVEVAREDGLWHLTAHGLGGHASRPLGKINAVAVLQQLIVDQQLASEQEDAFLRFMLKLHAVGDGSGVGIAAEDGYFTPLTAVSGMFYVEDGHLVQSLDCRYPTGTDAETIIAQLRKVGGEVAEITASRAEKPFYKDIESPEIKSCLDAYRFVTGDMSEPETIGGGTYAKHFPNAVAFGPEHEPNGYPAFAGDVHGPDEGASIAELLEALKVYILALLNLEKLDI